MNVLKGGFPQRFLFAMKDSLTLGRPNSNNHFSSLAEFLKTVFKCLRAEKREFICLEILGSWTITKILWRFCALSENINTFLILLHSICLLYYKVVFIFSYRNAIKCLLLGDVQCLSLRVLCIPWNILLWAQKCQFVRIKETLLEGILKKVGGGGGDSNHNRK